MLFFLSASIAAMLPATVGAHATLLSTSPTDGEVVDTAPSEVVLTFNESVRSVEGGMSLFDPSGNEVELTGTSRDEQVIMSLPDNMEDGTWTVGWRVVSADGHPISGALTFSIGVPSGIAPDMAIPQTSALTERATAVVQGIGYIGLLVAVGLRMFQHLVLRSPEPSSTIRACAVGAAVLGGIVWLVLIPLSTVRQQGADLSSVFQVSTWWAEVDGTVVTSSAMVASGLAFLLVTMRIRDERLQQALESAAVTLAVLGPTCSGHTRAFSPTWLFVMSNVVHTVVGAVWLGGLLGLAITLHSSRRAAPSDRLPSDRLAGGVARFSTVAGASLALLILSGLISGWLVLGAVRPFFESTYGRLVLLKIGLVAIVVLMAAWNRFRLVPVVVARRAREQEARQLLNRLVALEGVALIIVAVVTGFLVNQSPPSTAATTDEPAVSTFEIDVPLGSGSAVGTMSPLAPGTNTATFQILDAQGEPLTPQSLPRMQVSLPSEDLGPFDAIVNEAGEPATFEAAFDLPLPGEWEISLIVRTGTFEEPISTFMVEIPASSTSGQSDHDHGSDHEATMDATSTGTIAHSDHDHAVEQDEAASDTGTGIVYLSIANRGDEDDILLGGTTSRAEYVEFHEQVITDNVASMRPIDGGLRIPAGETIDLDPGTRHLMLVNLTEDNRAGDVFDLTLTFERAGEVTLQVPVRLDEVPLEGEPQSGTFEVGDLVLEGAWSRPAPSFASSNVVGRHHAR